MFYYMLGGAIIFFGNIPYPNTPSPPKKTPRTALSPLLFLPVLFYFLAVLDAHFLTILFLFY